MRRFAALCPAEEKVPSAMAQIGWTAHRFLLDSFGEDPELYAWYAAAAAEHRWSVRQLQGQIALGLHRRLGRAVTNFQAAPRSNRPDIRRDYHKYSPSSPVAAACRAQRRAPAAVRANQ